MLFKRCLLFSTLLFLIFSSAASAFVCEPTAVQLTGARHILREKQSGAVPPENGALRDFAVAWRYGETELVELYFKAGIVDYRDIAGRSLLHLGAENGWGNLIKAGLDCGLNVNEPDKSDRSPLHYAAREGRAGAAKMLIKQGANVNAADWRNQTPLHLTAIEGRAEIAQLLLKHGANPKIKTSYGKTAYSLATATGRKELARLLQPAESPFDFDEFKFDLNSIEPVLLPDTTGWAANRVFDPHIAKIGGQTRMFFATRESHPGPEGIGYINLDKNGLGLQQEKIKLKVKDGYHHLHSPFYLPPEHSAGNTNRIGQLYTTNYYNQRVGEWSFYINENELSLVDSKIKFSSEKTILTGSDKKSHWRSRSVSYPQVFRTKPGKILFFKAVTWPPLNSGERQTIGMMKREGNKWSKPKPLLASNHKKGIWPYVFAGFHGWEIKNGSYLFLLGARKRAEFPAGIRAVYYKNNDIVSSKILLSPEDLTAYLPNWDNPKKLYFRNFHPVKINGQYYLYFDLNFNSKKSKIFRIKINLPGKIRKQILNFNIEKKQDGKEAFNKPGKPLPKQSSTSPGTLNWEYNTGNRISAAPAIANDGTIYIGTLDSGIFYSITNNDSLNWTYHVGAKIRSATVGNNKNIYFGADNGNLYALSPEGKLLWKFKTDDRIIHPPVQDKSGNLYFGSDDHHLYAVTPSGKLKWSYRTNGVVRHVLGGNNNRIYAASHDKNLYALTRDGELLWKFKINGYPRPGTIDKNGTIYSGSHNPDGNLYAINPDGNLKWEYKVEGVRAAEPSVGKDGTVYVGEILSNRRPSSVYALTPGGQLKWKFKTGDRVSAKPLIGDNNKIYVGSWDNNLYVLNTDGSLDWKHKTDSEIKWQAKFDPHGNVIIATHKGILKSIGTKN